MELIKEALKGQYHAALTMLKEAIESCPEEIWVGGIPPRQFWRLAYHTLFFADIDLEISEYDFTPWVKHRDEVESDFEHEKLDAVPYTQAEVIVYLDLVEQRVDSQLDRIDLTSADSGVARHPIPRLDRQIMSLRHIQEHTGQLRDRLLEAGIDQRWVRKA